MGDAGGGQAVASKARVATLVGILVLLVIGQVASSYSYERSSQAATQTIISANAKAFIAYASNTGSFLMASPKGETWTGEAWVSPEELSTTGSTIRWLRAVSCPLASRYYEKIVITLSEDSYISAFVWTGSSWAVTDDIGLVNPAAAAYRSFDVAYEGTSGDAVLVYAVNSASGSHDIAYRVWNGAGWSVESYIDDAGHGGDINYRWMALRSDPTAGSDEIAMIAVNQSNGDADAWIWNGSSWGNFIELETNLSSVRTCECLGLAYESSSGRALFAWCAAGNVEARVWSGSAWEAEIPAVVISTTSNVRWITLKRDPASNMIMATTIDLDNDLNTILWDGVVWGAPEEHSVALTTTARRCADYEWEPSGSRGLLIYSEANGFLNYRTFTAPAAWGATQQAANPVGHPWVTMRRNPREVAGDVKIFGATLNGNNDLYGFEWDGSTLTIEGSAFTVDTTVAYYECFDIAVRPMMSPLG